MHEYTQIVWQSWWVRKTAEVIRLTAENVKAERLFARQPLFTACTVLALAITFPPLKVVLFPVIWQRNKYIFMSVKRLSFCDYCRYFESVSNAQKRFASSSHGFNPTPPPEAEVIWNRTHRNPPSSRKMNSDYHVGITFIVLMTLQSLDYKPIQYLIWFDLNRFLCYPIDGLTNLALMIY